MPPARRKPAPPASAPRPTDRIVVLHGPELFLLHEHTRQLRDALAAIHGEVQTLRFDGGSTTPAEVLDECRSFGLMGGHKLVVVDAAEQLVKEDYRPIMERYAAQPADSATLILRASDRWATGTRFDALVEAVGSVVACKPASPHEAAAWIVKRAKKRHACEVDPRAAAALVEHVGPDLARLDAEAAKLAAAAGPGAPVTTDLVRELVGHTREEDAWSIKRALASGSPEEAVRTLRLIMENSRRDEHVLLAFAAIDLTRGIHSGGHLLRGGASPGAVAGKLRFWGPDQDCFLAAARRTDPRTAAALFIEALEADARLKSSAGTPERTLERLAIRIASALAGSSDKR